MQADMEGFFYPEIDEKRCNCCNLCRKICPANNMMEIDNNIVPQVFAAINNDEKIRKDSTSGGIFTLLANEIISRSGVVFGVAFNDSFIVVHGYTDNYGGIAEFRGSKYVQSYIGESYQLCKKYLEEDRWLLFSGTPCQIAGLNAYVRKEYSKLICVDIICNSVASPEAWKKYLEYRERVDGSKPEKISFRYKNPSWKSSSMLFQYNDKIYTARGGGDLFLKTWYSGTIVRPSCYQCQFRTLNRQSDITIADFWGIEEVCPAMFDDKGTSLIFIHSKKGKELLENIKNNCTMIPVNIDSAIKNNRSAICSVININKKREGFVRRLNSLPFDILVKRYVDPSIVRKVYRHLKWRLLNTK
jgi:coenzyme F420-reducing hydrogenase beta subunit